MGGTMELDLQLPAARDGRAAERAATDGAGTPAGAGADATARAVAGGPAARGPAAPGPATQGPVARGPVERSPVTRSPVTRSPVARSPVGQGPLARRSVPHRPAPPSRDALALLRQAADQLAEAHRDPEPVRRYPAAYLAALRAGAAVLAMRARPRPRRGAPRDVWRLLAEVAPELEEWAAFFASCSRTRLAAEAGIDRLVDRRGADDLLRQAEQFVARVRVLLPR